MSDQEQTQNNGRSALKLAGMAFLMFGFATPWCLCMTCFVISQASMAKRTTVWRLKASRWTFPAR